MQGIAQSYRLTVPAVKNRSASSCQIQNRSLISQREKDNQKKNRNNMTAVTANFEDLSRPQTIV
jgi:hypothetical protein